MVSFVAIDFETANSKRSSICSVGLVIVENGEVTETFSQLAKPYPTHFQPCNVAVHGLTEEDVATAPSFPDLWKELKPIISDKTLVAYNASFDFGVLRAALDAHELPALPVNGSCILRLAKQAWPDLPNYKLSTVSRYLGVELDHHDALSDAQACAQIALHGIAELKLNTLPLLENRKSSSSVSRKIALHGFYEMIEDIIEDGMVTLREFDRLLNWLETNDNLLNRFPFSEVAKRAEDILEDNMITGEELDSLCVFLDALLERRSSPAIDSSVFTSNAESVMFDNKTFVFSGELEAMNRQNAIETAESLGAKVAKTVTRKTDFVVVGNKGNSRWKGGGFGAKIEKAISNRKNGCVVEIVSEVAFLQAAARHAQ